MGFLKYLAEQITEMYAEGGYIILGGGCEVNIDTIKAKDGRLILGCNLNIGKIDGLSYIEIKSGITVKTKRIYVTEKVEVYGSVEGDIFAPCIEIKDGGVVTGNIKTRKGGFIVAFGGRLEGKCTPHYDDWLKKRGNPVEQNPNPFYDDLVDSSMRNSSEIPQIELTKPFGNNKK